MKNLLLRSRYYLELAAVPAFVFLIIHLAGHGLRSLLDPSHGQHHGSEMSEVFDFEVFLKSFFSVEIWGGIFLLSLFVWFWHRPALKKWVPCSHDHCHAEFSISHVFAIMALCFHFFPEAGVRYELLHGIMKGEWVSLIAFIGFLAHFFVDVIVAVLLSSYWKTRWGFWVSFGSIVVVWFIAFFMAKYMLENIPPSIEGFVFLLSAFLLSMFVHKPHIPTTEGSHCKGGH